MRNQKGLSLPELLIVFAILAIALGISALFLEPFGTPIESGASLLESFVRDVRLRAIASTSAIRVRPIDTDSLVAERGGSCSTTAWLDAGIGLDLPTDVTLSDQSWSVCFTSRGISNSNVTIQVDHPRYDSRSIEVLVGGTTRVLK